MAGAGLAVVRMDYTRGARLLVLRPFCHWQNCLCQVVGNSCYAAIGIQFRFQKCKVNCIPILPVHYPYIIAKQQQHQDTFPANTSLKKFLSLTKLSESASEFSHVCVF
jgi:hypothetical protein